MSKFFIRVNGIGHAFSKELGCCCGRCQTINFNMTTPSGLLEPFDGWYDPPWRAHTSASILIPNENDDSMIKSHTLIDIGAGVIDGLVSSKLKGLENVDGLLISHWHPDHLLGINQFCESLKRTVVSQGRKFVKIPLFCTLETYDYLRGKFSYEVEQFLRFCEVIPEVPFKLSENSPITFTPVNVAHGKGGGTAKSAVIFIADFDNQEMKVIFGWDIDVPEAKRMSDGKPNIDVIRDNLSLLTEADILFMEANTWKEATNTGHTSFVLARQYIDAIQAKKVLLVHMSGHEDGEGNDGYGWNDKEWESAVDQFGVGIARQGMIIQL